MEQIQNVRWRCPPWPVLRMLSGKENVKKWLKKKGKLKDCGFGWLKIALYESSTHIIIQPVQTVGDYQLQPTLTANRVTE